MKEEQEVLKPRLEPIFSFDHNYAKQSGLEYFQQTKQPVINSEEIKRPKKEPLIQDIALCLVPSQSSGGVASLPTDHNEDQGHQHPVIDPNETFSNAKFVADSGISPNKNVEDVLADDEDSNDTTS